MKSFYTLLTHYGKTALAEALAAQRPLEIPFMAVGDGGGADYEPSEAQTNLRNEKWRGDLNDLRQTPNVQGQVIAEAIIPHGVDGDWMVREIGLFDNKGGLIAVGKYPETYIPDPLSGAKSQVYIRVVIHVDNVAALSLNINHDVVIASKAFVLEKGYGVCGSFELGLPHAPALENAYQLVFFEAENQLYRWMGEYPKAVPAKSTPSSTGGIGDGKWKAIAGGQGQVDVSQHNHDPLAHPELRAEMQKSVTLHNQDASAHPALHDFLAAETSRIETKIDILNETSLATGRIYKDTEDGLKYTQNGEHFKVIGRGADFAELYLNDNGQAIFVVSQPRTSAVKGVNLLYDALNEVSGRNGGFAYGDNIFSNNGGIEFKDTNNLGSTFPVAYRVENSSVPYISKQYPTEKLPLIKGQTLFCSALVYSLQENVEFSAYFRQGSAVVASKTVKSIQSGSVVLQLEIPIVDKAFDKLELRVSKGEGNIGLLELGGVSVSYGTYADFNTVNLGAPTFVNENLLWDSHQEYSSLDTTLIDWFKGKSPSFVNDVNMGVNTLNVSEAIYKEYDLTHLNIQLNVPLYSGVVIYNQQGGAQVTVQYLKEGKFIDVQKTTLKAGMNEVSLKSILTSKPDMLRFFIEPVVGVKTLVNDFFVSYINVNPRTSGAKPPKYRFLSPTPAQNLLWDMNNEVSALYPFDWFDNSKIGYQLRVGQYLKGENVIFAKGTGRVAKSYAIKSLGLQPNTYLSVGCQLHVESGSCHFYAQFMNGKDYIRTPQKVFSPGTHDVHFFVSVTNTLTDLNFIFDIAEGGQIEATGFTLAQGLASTQQSAPLPTEYMLSITKLNQAASSSSPLRNYFIKTEQLALNQALINEVPSGMNVSDVKDIKKQRLSIAFIGDSWTHSAPRYSGSLATQLTQQFGDAGAGWISFSAFNRLSPEPWLGGNGNIRPHLYTIAYDDNAKWNKGIYANCSTPDICTAGSDVVGAKITVTGIRAVQNATLLYLPSEGVIEYRFNGSDWVTVNLQGTGKIGTVELKNLPQTERWTFELVVKSGLCRVSGMNVIQSDNGVICHKLGATGSKARDWAAQDGAAMIESFKLLKLDTAFVLLGTNDQGAKYTPQSFRDYIQSMVNRLRRANPAIDICLVAPCENLRTENLYPMSDYASQIQAVASLNDCSYLNLQDSFGLNPSYYAADGINPLFHSDEIHPEPATGGRLISATILKHIQ